MWNVGVGVCHVSVFICSLMIVFMMPGAHMCGMSIGEFQCILRYLKSVYCVAFRSRLNVTGEKQFPFSSRTIRNFQTKRGRK